MIISAVVVTYNRIELLKECLTSYINQTRLPDKIIVVDNASTDGTREYLDTWKNDNDEKTKIHVIHLSENKGGSGGFHEGLKTALELNSDWVCVADDDAILAEDVFEKAEKHIMQLPSDATVSAICTKVITDGCVSLFHRTNRRILSTKILPEPISEETYEQEFFECDSASYVGAILNCETLKEVGITEKNYFIWNDDAEHFWRLSKAGKIICYTDMMIDHKVNQPDYDCLSWKTYYGYRNYILMVKKHLGFKYFLAYIVRTLSRGPRDLSWKHTKLGICAVWDAIRNKQGIHKTYKPGWK